MDISKTVKLELDEIKGIGPTVLSKLEKLNIFSIEDLLNHYPTRYIDRRKNLKITDLRLVEDTSYHAVGRVQIIKKIFLRNKRELTTATFSDDTDIISVTWFNNPYISNQIHIGDIVVFSGEISKGKLINPKVKRVNSTEDIKAFARIEAIYPETRGLRSYQISQFIKEALEKLENEKTIKETLPKKVLTKEKFVPRLLAYKFIHFPNDTEEIKQARLRFGFEEIYIILKQIQKHKKSITHYQAPCISINSTTHEVIIKKLSFTLTPSQKTAIKEIFADISKEAPMHRLLNGDVGSGKTIVAASAVWQVVNNGMQALVLAPTGVLAKQHFDTFEGLFKDFSVEIFLETSNTRKELDNKRVRLSVTSDKNQIIIGTHALLYRTELLRNVGLVVIDEQHKFGVKQRELLEQLTIGGNNLETEKQNIKSKVQKAKKVPHVLSMSATPIPRSLALTLFGDIDISFLEKPIERKKIITKVINDNDLERRMEAWIHEQIYKNKEQVYVVCPLIEDSSLLEAKSVIAETERIKQIFPKAHVAMLHGKMKQAEKDQIILDFKKGLFDILVTTSVIEVGIDNPKATIMIIEGAERFGLAQLHQIRGRVGRSGKQSYCFLKTTDGTNSKRLTKFAETEDGFTVAEYDLLTRGPGEVYGNMQSGIPNLKIANILDLKLIKKVKEYF